MMALAMVWQYFNKIFGTDNDVRYSNHFLLIAPNLIVLDQLYGSAEEGKVDLSAVPDTEDAKITKKVLTDGILLTF